MEERKKRHLFLTGAKGVGKSTLLRSLLAGKGPLGGFRTVRVVHPGGANVYILPASGDENYCEGNLLFTCGNTASPEVFDRLGCAMLTDRQAAVVVMDELGPAEVQAFAFQRAVLAQLDGDIPVYGVIQQARIPFLDAVRAHPAVELVEVTADNRNALVEELKKIW